MAGDERILDPARKFGGEVTEVQTRLRKEAKTGSLLPFKLKKSLLNAEFFSKMSSAN
ncbi:hypothetical protein RvY_01292 [Ramazzottius varieornatus]|uniref:Uncharacterized protein n=1 Tax=Ramazzottius varieornatus TaxID=947166 RepID=A0A1D1UJR3_RAMVA|nr:hypothetical protein RvY_01292 [Ramazzottius varieornatus]